MSLEDFSWLDEWSEWASNSSDKVWEFSEKFRDAIKKWTQKAKWVKRDEWKAKKHDLILANFLVKIIVIKKYDPLLEYLFKSMDEWYISNFLLWIISLVLIEISNKIRETSGKKPIIFNYKKTKEKVEFHDDELDDSIRDRINSWIEDMIDVVSIEYSSILTEKLLDLLKEDENIIIFVSVVFKFFLDEINISITDNKSYDISKFIVWEIKKSLKKLYLEEI